MFVSRQREYDITFHKILIVYARKKFENLCVLILKKYFINVVRKEIVKLDISF